MCLLQILSAERFFENLNSSCVPNSILEVEELVTFNWVIGLWNFVLQNFASSPSPRLPDHIS